MKNKKGFTLVELLVVIAIIGILSTVAVVNLNSARDKAKISAALSFAQSYQAPALLCDMQENGLINNPAVTGAYVGGGAFCTVDIDVIWPVALPENYEVAAAVDATAGDNVWQIFVVDTDNALSNVLCDNSGCRTL